MLELVKCSDCGAVFDPNLPVCPECGSGDRIIRIRDVVDLKVKRELWENPPAETPDD